MTNRKSTKRALLMSVLSLLLCMSMLVGTTFAWFTDSVTSGSNVIQAGTLDIVMEYWDGDSWEDAEGQVLEFIKGGNYHGYVGEVLWEPGCTYELPKIRVRNEGNLAAKVLLKVNGITGDEKLLEAVEFKTKVENIPASLKTGSAGAEFTAMEGNSYNLMYGTPDGTVMMDWTVMAKGHTSLNTGHTDTSAEFTISGHMQKEAGNEYQGLKIEGVSITALATQEVYEYDSFGREYDKNAQFPEVTVVSNATELADAIAAGDNVVLAADIDLGSTTVTVPNGVTTTLDLNGCVISGVCNAANGTAFTVNNGATLNIKDSGSNGKISYAAGSANQGYAIKQVGNLNLYSGTIELTGNWSDGICYAVDIAPNVWSGTTTGSVFNMYGGKVVSSKDAIRIANYSATGYGAMNVGFNMEGGEVIAARDGIFMQQHNANQFDLFVTVTGGTIKADVRPIRVYGPNATGTLSGNAKSMTITAKSDALVLNGTVDTSMTWHTEGKIAVGGGMTVDNLNQFANITLN